MPDLFLSLKLVHLFAAILMVGATVINGLIHNMARKASPARAEAMLSIVLAVNSYFMGPSLLALPLTGGGLMWLAGYDFDALWLLLSIVLSVFLIVAYIFGARLEHRLFEIATSTECTGEPILPAQYQRVFRKAAPIGSAALLMSLAALSFMVFKPY
nr:DUF2269 family protein [uncultured Cohaesibacter sp.]